MLRELADSAGTNPGIRLLPDLSLQQRSTPPNYKYSWCFASFDFLGYHVGKGRLSIPHARVAQISDYIMPSNRASLKSFLGLITFYSKFIPHLARFTTILNGYMPKDNSTGITISEEFSTAFKNIISAVSHHSSLIIPTPADPLSIFSDASTSGVGGTLCVYRDLQWLPCSFYSRQLLPRERNYAILDLEALALLATIHHFHYYLSGVYFKAFTDHKPLINILNGQPPSARLLFVRLSF